jgi:phospholipid transport system substrate-binding protein
MAPATRRATKATLATLLLLVISTNRAEALAQSPMTAIKRTNARIDKLLAKKKTAKVDQKLKREVNQFLDFRELARRSLGKHWKKRSADERKEFVAILRQLIEHNYLKQARKNTGQNVDYRSEKIRGKKAKVVTAIKVKKKRRMQEVLVVYKLRKRDGRWVVYDVVTDDVSIVRNYRSQFNRIIKKKSYEHLVKKMRKKLKKIS